MLIANNVEDWIDDVVDELMERFEKAGTPVRGGYPIAEALRAAYLRGQGDSTLVKEQEK